MFRYFVLTLLTILLSTSAIAQNRFVGSEKCMVCHTKIYETWKEGTHYKAVQTLTPSNDSVIADWKGEVKLKTEKIPEATIKLGKDSNGNYLATLIDSKEPSKKVTYKVERVQGSGSVKGQQYYVKIGNYYYSLPIFWETISSKFKNTLPSSLDTWYAEDGSLKQPAAEKSWEMTCAGCHQTGVEYKKIANGYEFTSSELSIGCEKCHGPGSGHVAASGAKNTIINPRDLGYERGMDVCNQCHDTQGQSVPGGVIRGAWNEDKSRGYVIGEPLTNYMQAAATPGSSVLRPLSSADTYHQLAAGKHGEAMTNCFDCHDPHGGPAMSNLKRPDFNNTLCLHCHAKEKEFASPTMIIQHTRHSYDPDMKGTSRCTNCHLLQSRRIRTPTTGSGMPSRMMAGFLQVVKPQQSLEMFKSNPNSQSTNSCNKCHKDWSGDEAGYKKGVAAYEAKFGQQ
jgi:predicted CXXCH cytochrome family protein